MPKAPKLPKPYATGMLPVTSGHSIYYEQYGNPNGIPVVRLHGGPGSGSKPKHALLYDLKKMNLTLFDQRGCGRSTPTGELRHNTTQHIIADADALRAHLGHTRWMVVGSSWGSTLALAYAQAHPQRVSSLVVSAIFLGTPDELDWATQPHGMARFAPREYAEVLELFPGTKPHKLPKAIYKAVTGKDHKFALEVAARTTLFEAMTMDTAPDLKLAEADIRADPNTLTRNQIYWHYAINGWFFKPNQLLKNTAGITHIPTAILQGTLDLCCPPGTAYKLAQALPKASFHLEPLCGHYANASMQQQIAAIIKKLATR
jgi:proline iminopeptidase